MLPSDMLTLEKVQNIHYIRTYTLIPYRLLSVHIPPLVQLVSTHMQFTRALVQVHCVSWH